MRGDQTDQSGSIYAFGEAGGVIGLGYSAVLWFLLGYVVLRGDSRQAAPTPESAVQ